MENSVPYYSKELADWLNVNIKEDNDGKLTSNTLPAKFAIPIINEAIKILKNKYIYGVGMCFALDGAITKLSGKYVSYDLTKYLFPNFTKNNYKIVNPAVPIDTDYWDTLSSQASLKRRIKFLKWMISEYETKIQ